MATVSLSFVAGSHCISCGTIKSSKLYAAASSDYYGRRGAHNSLMKAERNLVCGDITNNGRETFSRNCRLEVLAVSRIFVTQTVKKASSYLFRTEIGGLVKVIVENENNKYKAFIEASSFEGELIMSWGTFRSDSSSFLPLDFHKSGSVRKLSPVETPFVSQSFDRLTAELDFEGNLAPFYVSFLLKAPSNGNSKSSEIRSHRKTSFCFPVGISSGCPSPLGISYSSDGSLNFAFFSRNAESVVLCLFDDDTKEKPALEIDLDPYVNRSGDIWHASMDTSTMNFKSYGYRCRRSCQEKVNESHVLLDPYAKVIAVNGLGQLTKEPAFNWGRDFRPCLPMEKLVVYRLNVKKFTQEKSSNLSDEISGTFSGIIEKLPHFKNLGVNSILLEPIFLFGKQEGPYSPCHFFSPMNIYGPSGGPISSIVSMKEMIKSLHANGIEVFLEVVYGHSAEDGALIKIDKSSYFLSEGDQDLSNRNALNCNHPIVQQLILDSLRHWVIDYHVDGFCFIGADSMLRGSHGEILSRPPLIEAIAFDPILSKAKIIADCSNASTGEMGFPHWRRWAEMNSKFCIDVRKYLKGDGLLSNLATRLCGSGDIFLNGRGPAFSFNYISRNFGLPLVDLVSFSNPELASELSWNCGEEGPTKKTAVLERRLKQIRNYIFILFVSLGIPVLNMGDECGHSSGGSVENKDRKPFNWNSLGTGFGIQTTQFISFMSCLRTRRSDILQKRSFLKEESIFWHGSDLSPPNWEDPNGKFLATTLKSEEEEEQEGESTQSSGAKGGIFVAFNAADQVENVMLPAPPDEMGWVCLVDTARPYPGFFSMDGEPVVEHTPGVFAYQMESHSCILLEARSLNV